MRRARTDPARKLANLSLAATPSRWVRVLAAISTALGLPAAADGTVAMGQGITILLVSSLPLVAALGLLATGSGRRPLHVWGPLILLGLVVGTVVYAYGDGPDADRMAPAFAVGSALLGVALAWWVTARVRGTGGERLLVGVSIGLVGAAFQGTYLLPLAVFVAPVVAAIVTFRGDLRPPTQCRPHVARQHSQHLTGAPISAAGHATAPPGTSPVWCAAKASRSAHSAACT